MSGSDAMTCAEAAARLYELIDGELTPQLEAAVRHHLDECAPCYGRFEFEQAFKRFLIGRGRRPTPPDRLREMISAQLAGEDPGNR